MNFKYQDFCGIAPFILLDACASDYGSSFDIPIVQFSYTIRKQLQRSLSLMTKARKGHTPT